MRCRHTVADWRRHVVNPDEAAPIFAACRLLVNDGVPAADTTRIACGYWGRQEACPLYEGPAGRAAAAVATTSTDTRADEESPWPVRAPGEADVVQAGLVGLHVASIILLVTAWIGGFGAREWLGVGAIGLSVVTHVLGGLRAWAGR